MTLVATHLLTITGCTVWQTDRSAALVKGADGRYREVDQTRVRDGQPYFLPKGMIHLVIKSEAGKSDPAAAVSTPVVNKTTGNAVLPAPAPAGQSETAAASTSTQDGVAESYAISMNVEFDPDEEAGKFYAHYSPNWMFNDQVGVQVNNKRLLHTLNTTTTDETKNIVDKITDTVTNLVKASVAFSMGRSGPGNEMPNVASQRQHKTLVVKELNIDERFDPLDPKDCARIRELFGDQMGKRYEVVSPFKIEIRQPQAALGVAPAIEKVHRQGLLFREPQQVEIVLKRNPRLFELSRDALTEVCNNEERVGKELNDLEKAQSKTPNPPINPNPGLAALKAVAPSNAEDAGLNAKKAEFTALQTERGKLEQLYFRAQPGSAATVGRLTAVVADKRRLYTLAVKRGAFITRTTELQIDNGMMMGIGHQKPSEVLGFMEIPLSVSSKILALPKDIFSTKTDVLTQKNNFTAQQAKSGN